MYQMTSKERFARAFKHQEADRVVMWDFPWPGALRRWQKEGMPAGVSYEDYFDVDKVGRVVPDNSPRYPVQVVAEDDVFITESSAWGTHVRNFKMQDSTPDFVKYTIVDWDSWLKAKERITPDRDRIPWAHLEQNYKEWVKEGRWLLADTYFTFNNLSAEVMGLDTFLIYMATDPELVIDMMSHSLEVNLVDEGLPSEFMYAEVEFESVEEARVWDPAASGLGSYLDDDVTEKPGQSMSAYWMVTRELIHGLD